MHRLFAFALGGWQKAASLTIVASMGVTGVAVQMTRNLDRPAETQSLDVVPPSAADTSAAHPEPEDAASSDARTSERPTGGPADRSGIPEDVDLPSASPLPVPTDLPDIVPTPKPAAAAVEGPGFCEGTADMLDRTRARREAAAEHAHQGSYEGRLGEFVPIDSPYEDWHAGYHGEVTAYDVAHGTRQYRESSSMFDQHGFRGGYDRGWQGKGAASSGGSGAVEFYVYEFASTDDALAFQEESMSNACEEAKHTFTMPDVPSAVGLSLRYSFPEAQEEVSFVLGPRVYFVELYQDHHDDGYHQIVDLAKLGKRVAR